MARWELTIIDADGAEVFDDASASSPWLVKLIPPAAGLGANLVKAQPDVCKLEPDGSVFVKYHIFCAWNGAYMTVAEANDKFFDYLPAGTILANTWEALVPGAL